MDAKIDSISAREKPPFCLGSVPEMIVFKRVFDVTTLIVLSFNVKCLEHACGANMETKSF